MGLCARGPRGTGARRTAAGILALAQALVALAPALSAGAAEGTGQGGCPSVQGREYWCCNKGGALGFTVGISESCGFMDRRSITRCPDSSSKAAMDAWCRRANPGCGCDCTEIPYVTFNSYRCTVGPILPCGDTPSLKCVPGQAPLRCYNGERTPRSSMCGCPAGQERDGEGCRPAAAPTPSPRPVAPSPPPSPSPSARPSPAPAPSATPAPPARHWLPIDDGADQGPLDPAATGVEAFSESDIAGLQLPTMPPPGSPAVPLSDLDVPCGGRAYDNLAAYLDAMASTFEGMARHYAAVAQDLAVVEDGLGRQCDACGSAISQVGGLGLGPCDGRLLQSAMSPASVAADPSIGPALCRSAAGLRCERGELKVCAPVGGSSAAGAASPSPGPGPNSAAMSPGDAVTTGAKLLVPIPRMTASMDTSHAGDSGMDVGVRAGTLVQAVADGTIVYSERGHTPWNVPPDTPNSVLVKLKEPVEYGGKSYGYVWYTHLETLAQQVPDGGAGKPIARGAPVGTTGLGNRVPHLHFSILADRAQGPGQYMTPAQIHDYYWGTGGAGAGQGGASGGDAPGVRCEGADPGRLGSTSLAACAPYMDRVKAAMDKQGLSGRIDPLQLAALMMQESSCNPSVNCGGIMQVDDPCRVNTASPDYCRCKKDPGWGIDEGMRQLRAKLDGAVSKGAAAGDALALVEFGYNRGAGAMAAAIAYRREGATLFDAMMRACRRYYGAGTKWGDAAYYCEKAGMGPHYPEAIDSRFRKACAELGGRVAGGAPSPAAASSSTSAPTGTGGGGAAAAEGPAASLASAIDEAVRCPICLALPCARAVACSTGKPPGSSSCDASASCGDILRAVQAPGEPGGRACEVGPEAGDRCCAPPGEACPSSCGGSCRTARASVVTAPSRTVVTSPAGLAACQRALAELKDACTVDGSDLLDGSVLDPCAAAARVSDVRARLDGNAAGIASAARELRAMAPKVRPTTSGGAPPRDLDANIDALAGSLAPRGTDAASEGAFQNRLTAVVSLAAGPLRADVGGSAGPADGLQRSVLGYRGDGAWASFCGRYNLAPSGSRAAGTASAALGAAAGAALSSGAGPASATGSPGSGCGGSAGRCESRLSDGSGIAPSNADAWSAGHRAALDALASLDPARLFMGVRSCFRYVTGSNGTAPPSPAQCEEGCSTCYGVRESHCHPELGVCVCHTPSGILAIDIPCAAGWDPGALARARECCAPGSDAAWRKGANASAGKPRLPANDRGAVGAPSPAWGIAACQSPASVGRATFDLCVASGAAGGLCCLDGAREVPAVEEACAPARNLTCEERCLRSSGGDASRARTCIRRCAGGSNATSPTPTAPPNATGPAANDTLSCKRRCLEDAAGDGRAAAACMRACDGAPGNGTCEGSCEALPERALVLPCLEGCAGTGSNGTSGVTCPEGCVLRLGAGSGPAADCVRRCGGGNATCAARCAVAHDAGAERDACLAGCGLPGGTASCIGNCTASGAGAEACARLCAALAPAIDVTDSALLRGTARARTFFAGERARMLAHVNNTGGRAFEGRLRVLLRSMGPCDCPPCPEGYECGCACAENSTLVGEAPVERLGPGEGLAHISGPFELNASLANATVRPSVEVVGGGGEVLARGEGALAHVVGMGDVAVTDASFIDEAGAAVTAARPGTNVTGRISVTARRFPVKVEAYVVIGEGHELLGTRASAAVEGPVEGLEVRTRPLALTEDHLGMILHMAVRVTDGSGAVLLDERLEEQGFDASRCRGSHMTTWCQRELARVRLGYPSAYVEVRRPMLKVVHAAFLGEDGSQVSEASPGEEVAFTVVVRNMEPFPFSGGAEASAAPPGGPPPPGALANSVSSGLGRGANLTLRSAPFVAFDVWDGASRLGLHVRAQVAGGAAWLDEDVDALEFPRARLSARQGALAQDPSALRTINTTFLVGSCLLHVMCEGCLPTCELNIDRSACSLVPRSCGCTCSTGGG